MRDENYIIEENVPLEVGDYICHVPMFNGIGLEGVYRAVHRRANQEVRCEHVENPSFYINTYRGNKILNYE